jgi:hypothetical protein
MGVNVVRQTEVHRPEPSTFEIEIPFEKLKRYKYPVHD